jgi:transcriptional regulator with XRE-family HTH domain
VSWVRQYDEVLGREVRLRREAAGKSQEEVTRHVRPSGLPWTKTTLSKVERGERTLTATEVLLVAESVGVPVDSILDRGVLIEPMDMARRAWRDSEVALGDGDIEQRVAERLNVEVEWVTTAARQLWGLSLGDERDQQTDERLEDGASPARRQAARGHVTGELMDKLRRAIAARSDQEKRRRTR